MENMMLIASMCLIRRRRFLVAGLASALFLLAVLRLSGASIGGADDMLWPSYRHDQGLTGHSPIKGGLATAPRELWSVDLVSGVTGKKRPLWQMHDVFHHDERLGHILPGVRGEQLCAWWSGAPDPLDKENQNSYGYLWSFENGLESPVQRLNIHEKGI